MDSAQVEKLATMVSKGTTEGLGPIMREAILGVGEIVGARVDKLRDDVFAELGRHVTRDECKRTHDALPPVTILTAIGGSAVVSSVVTGIAVYAITRG